MLDSPRDNSGMKMIAMDQPVAQRMSAAHVRSGAKIKHNSSLLTEILFFFEGTEGLSFDLMIIPDIFFAAAPSGDQDKHKKGGGGVPSSENSEDSSPKPSSSSSQQTIANAPTPFQPPSPVKAVNLLPEVKQLFILYLQCFLCGA